jgi:peptide subunit release factor RF-3
LGELLREGQRKGLIADKGENQSNLVTNGNKVKQTLPDIGISRKQSSTFQQIASIPEDTFEEFIQEKKQKVNDAVSELTTTGAVRLARSLKEKENHLSVIEDVNVEIEIRKLAKEINLNYTKEYRNLLVSLIKI